MNWPRLSQTLSKAVDRYTCQQCGARSDLPCVWQEHDECDRPETIAVTLCKVCSERIIEAHPRLYALIQAGQPFPGAMPTCQVCNHRTGLTCGHPDLKANGGSGLKLSYPEPARAFVCARGGKGGPRAIWMGPVSCAGFETGRKR